MGKNQHALNGSGAHIQPVRDGACIRVQLRTVICQAGLDFGLGLDRIGLEVDNRRSYVLPVFVAFNDQPIDSARRRDTGKIRVEFNLSP